MNTVVATANEAAIAMSAMPEASLLRCLIREELVNVDRRPDSGDSIFGSQEPARRNSARPSRIVT
ncbi:MAG: hypothetical protein ACRCV5_22140, partial [Afipia sp.]